jgi:hypothetical protein
MELGLYLHGYAERDEERVRGREGKVQLVAVGKKPSGSL